MSVLSIRTVPDPVLRSQTSQVPAHRFGSTSLKQLVNSMHETMDAVQGVGLAAPQVGIGQAIFVFNLEERQGHVINPVIETWGDPTNEPKEGCLSVPELYYTPPRARYAKVNGFDVEGSPVAYEGEGLFARMLQHEVDHLAGYLFVDRLNDQELREARRTMASQDYMNVVKRVNSERATGISTAFGSSSAFGQPTS